MVSKGMVVCVGIVVGEGFQVVSERMAVSEVIGVSILR